jgi:hypothetical protein
MQRYMAPELTNRGGVTESTRAVDVSRDDPRSPILLGLLTPDSLGFQL